MTFGGSVARVATAVAIGLAALFGARAATPSNVFACYCTMPASVAEYRTEPDVVIVAGTLIKEGSFRVERVYRGPIALGPNEIDLLGSSCDFPIRQGERWVMASRVWQGALRPDICTHHARVGTPEGDALLDDIAAVYGAQAPIAEEPPAGATPDQPAPIATAEASLPQAFDPVQLAIVFLAPFVGIVLIVVVVAAFRRRDEGMEAR